MKLFIKQTIAQLRRIPLPAYISAGALLTIGLYVWVFIIPTNIQFSYASEASCTSWVTIAPRLHQQRAGKNAFEITLKDEVTVFNVPIFSRTTCMTPVSSPDAPRTKVSIAPFGLPIFSKTFGVNTPEAPTAYIKELNNAEISAVKPLLIPLSTPDVINTYTVRQDNKSATCVPADEGVSCAIKQLALSTDTPYDLSLHRSFQGGEAQQLEEVPVRTLTAMQLKDSTVKNEAIIYDTPEAFSFTFDREVEAVEGSLRLKGKTADIATTLSAAGKTVTVTPDAPLPRNAEYVINLEQVTGKDGSSLAEPIVTIFTLSGGPKVTGVSIEGSNVPQSSTIVVTFDQKLKEGADIAKFARITGINATLSRASDNSIAFTVNSAPLCAGFSIGIDKGIPSGTNSEVSAEGWKFNSRITCGYSSVIGYSVYGRPIISYTFGSGASTILFTGGMHGSEPSGTSTMHAWVYYLQSYGYQIPADKKIVIVPNTNPDAIAVGSRNNANNVNIDRNFPSANWRPDIDTAIGLLPTGGGTSAGSEPETKALIALTRQLRPRLEVSFHAQGSLVGANQFGDSSAIANTYGNTVGYSSMIGNAEEVMGYSITGEYEDWMGEEMGIPAILIELPTHSGNYLSSQLTALLGLLKV